MKNLIYIFLLIFCSCGPIATFTEPQPENVNSLKQIPRKLRGEFLSEDNKQHLLISANSIIASYDYYEKNHKDSLPSYYTLRQDSLFEDSIFNQLVIIKHDTIFKHVQYKDTLFSLQNNGQIKKFRGYYFINKLWNEQSWEVKKLQLRKGVLSISSISTVEEIELLKEITETPQDSLTNNYKLNKKQFKEFIKANGFQGNEYFLKVK
jgi:hypothetical protein